MSLTWMLETEVFSDRHQALADAVRAAGCRVISWREEWADASQRPSFDGDAVIFHGSLSVAELLFRDAAFRPGALCDTTRFLCSKWFPTFKDSLIQEQFCFSTVRQLTDHPEALLTKLGSPSQVFVRPDSPLKPFSGRVCESTALTPRALDHGFYYDDLELPVLVCSPMTISSEWRFIAVSGSIVAASAYVAEDRRALEATIPDEAQHLAGRIAAHPDWCNTVFVVDIGLSERGYRLVELNPFSGADLYHCDRNAVVQAVNTWFCRP